MVTIIDKKLSDDNQYVLVTLSTGEEIAINASWATQYVQVEIQQDVMGDISTPVLDSDGNPVLDSDGNPEVTVTQGVVGQQTVWQDGTQTLLEYEIQQTTIAAQARIDASAANAQAAQNILDSL